jgi:hypothetical protein
MAAVLGNQQLGAKLISRGVGRPLPSTIEPAQSSVAYQPRRMFSAAR